MKTTETKPKQELSPINTYGLTLNEIGELIKERPLFPEKHEEAEKYFGKKSIKLK